MDAIEALNSATFSKTHKISDQSGTEERFTRIEEKFFLPQNLRESFLALVENHLPASYPHETTRYTLIESIYFDSHDLRSFTDHFDQLPYRFKMRSRRYGPNGEWEKPESSTVFIELKTKQNNVSDKFRTKIQPDELKNLQNGGRINANEKKSALKINQVIDECKLAPSAKIIYRRYAFEKDAIRLTVDDQVQFKPEFDLNDQFATFLQSKNWWPNAEQMSRDIFNQGNSLVELKHFGKSPAWLQEYMQANNLQFTSFSKYCYSMANLIKSKAK